MYRLLLFIFLFISNNTLSQIETTLSDSLPNELIDSANVVSDSVLVSDSLAVQKIISDSLKALQQKADSLIIFTGKPFFDGSIILSHSDLLKNDYKYTGDFFRLSGLSFTKDYGFIGQNNETIIYGTGFQGISYFEDGVLLNHRSMNILDLNNVPSELIDSIEILPAVRGFLYGTISNPVSVNFISKDRIPGAAFSRIKYYEGPFGDAMIDGIFSTTLFRKMFLYFEASNRKVDSRYVNSSFSNWLGKIKLKYLLNNFLNLQASYGYVKSVRGLNGGVDVNSIMSVTSNIDSLLYNEVLAPVMFNERSYDVKQHNFGLRILSEVGEISKTDMNIYYKFSLEELNSSETPALLARDLKDKTVGVSLRQIFSKGILSAEINGAYEYTDYLHREYFQVDTLSVAVSDVLYDSKQYSVSGIFSVRSKNDKLKFAAFGKLSGIKYSFSSNLKNLIGYGFDIVFEPLSKVSLYAGYSYFEPLRVAENISTFEGGIKFNDENIFASLRAFLRNSETYLDPILFKQMNNVFNPFQDMLGVELNLKIKFWKLLFEGRGSFYSEASDETTVYNIPAQHFNAGIYFADTLFNSNLDLKTGFVFYFTGKQNLFNYTVPNSSRLDFTLAGEIQKSAIAYFTWENLLGAEYFIVPYYPMPLRGIRFGVSWEFLN